MIKVLIAASECAPVIKVGGLGDVIGSLPKALKKVGISPAIIVPRYEIVNIKNLRVAISHPVVFNKKQEPITLFRGFLPRTQIPVFYIDNKKYLSSGGPVYFSKTAVAEGGLEFNRFHFFCHAVYELLASGMLPFRPDVIHANDWHTGVLVKLLNLSAIRIPRIFTIHNLGNQGVFRGRNSMAEGIKNATAVTTVSPAYAKEVQTKEYGSGLEKFLKKAKPVGILNGIDYITLTKKFNKDKKKLSLQKELGLASGLKYPAFGLVARLVEQKGIHLITPVVGRLIKKCRAQFIFLGVGESRYEQQLRNLAKKYPRYVSANIFFSESLAQKIYIGSDFFLIPSLFEPCGLGQMISMHYGTIPIVRATGGLKDTVQEGETGFVFKSKGIDDFLGVIYRATAVFQDKAKFSKMRQRCRKQDFSWEESAQKYKNLYQSII